MMLVRSLMSLLVISGLAVAGGCSHQQRRDDGIPVARSTRTEGSPPLSRREPADTSPSSDGAAPVRGDHAIFFDFDSSVVRDDAHPTLQKLSSLVRNRRDERLRVEGNCDEMGTVEYNIALGEHRAKAAKDYLVQLGIPRERITTISYGSQRPKYPGDDDAARAKNRRDDFVVIR